MAKNKEELIKLLFATSRLIREKFKETAESGGISFTHLKALRFIGEKEKPTMKEIADSLGITPPSATSLIEPFVQNGWLKRVYDETDRRIVRLALTAKGQETLDEASKMMVKKLEDLLANLNEQQMVNLREILETLSDSIQ